MLFPLLTTECRFPAKRKREHRQNWSSKVDVDIAVCLEMYRKESARGASTWRRSPIHAHIQTSSPNLAHTHTHANNTHWRIYIHVHT